MRPLDALSALFALVLLLAQSCTAQGDAASLPPPALGSDAIEVQRSCPASSFYAEDFYFGSTLVGAYNETTLGECCVMCSNTRDCEKWSYCPLDSADGCTVPAGPLANQTFAPGACLLTSGRSSDGLTIVVWDRVQSGLPWLSGEVTDQAPIYEQSAEGAEADIEKLRFNDTQHFFCRRVAGGPLQLSPLEAGSSPAGARLTDGQEVAYAGLTLNDSEGQEWALVYSPAVRSLALYPAASLDYCAEQHPGCPAGAGSTEQGASCETDSDCCGGMVCIPRGVASVQASYLSDDGSVGRSPQFAVASSAGTSGSGSSSSLQAVPNECALAVLSTGGSTSTQQFNRPAADANGTALAWCLDWQAGAGNAQQCGDAAAAAFCADRGFDGVADAAGPLPVQEATLSPLTGAECDPAEWGQCETFEYITCSRQPAR
ncbi:hypothetical protein ABPG75_005764 [Micractinium tetrahymenae]